MRQLFKIIIWVIGIMSGVLSLYRELYSLYRGTLPSQNVFWTCARIAFVLSVALVFGEENREKRKLRQRLESLENSRPKIVLKQPGAVHIEPNVYVGSIFVAQFLRVRFVNTPDEAVPSAVAEAVAAKISYFREGENNPILSIDGRWADSDQPTPRERWQSYNDLLRIKFDIGDEHNVDVAYRDSRTGECFAWNNDNYNYQDMTKPEHKLSGEVFRVQVRLVGARVDSTTEFRFSNSADGLRILS